MGKRIESPITREEYDELDRLAKRANQRIASMTEGQRRAIESYRGKENMRFSRAMPKTKGEYIQRMHDIDRFLKSKLTTRGMWNKIKKDAVKKANETLTRERKTNLTDDELATIFEEATKRRAKDYYAVIDLVVAEKYLNDELSERQLQDVIDEYFEKKIEAGEAIRIRNEARKRANIESKKAKELRKTKKRPRRRASRK